MYEVFCPNQECKCRLATELDIRGKSATCPSCGTVFDVPKDLKPIAAPGSQSTSGKPAAGGQKPAADRPSGARRKPAGGTSGAQRAAGGSAKPGSGQSGAKKSGSGRKPGGSSRSRSGGSSAAGGRGSASRSGGSGGRGRPAERRRPKRARVQPEIDYDDDVEEFDDYDDYDDGYADDSYDDPYDDYDRGGRGGWDDNDDLDLTSQRSRRRGKSKANWKLVKVGVLILAIANCVIAGALAFTSLGLGTTILSFIILKNAAPDPDDFSNMSMEERFNARNEAMKDFRDSMETAGDFRDAATVIFKIGQVIWMVAAIGVVVGFVFCIFGPFSNGIRGLAIAATSVTAVSLILRIILKMVPMLSDDAADEVYDILVVAITGGRAHSGGEKTMAMLIDILSPTELILGIVLMLGIAKAKKTGSRDSCFVTLYLAIGFAVVLMVLYMIAFFSKSSSGEGLLYTCWIFSVVMYALWGTATGLYIRTLFKTRSGI